MSIQKNECFWHKYYPNGVPNDIDPYKYPNLVALIDEGFSEHPSDVAYTCLGKSITFSEVKIRCETLAHFLIAKGLKKGDRVGIMLPNLLQNPISILGVLKAGLVVVNINPLYTARELQFQLDDSGATAIIILGNFCDKLSAILKKTAISTVITTNIGDLLGPKGILINNYLRYFKRALPTYDFANAYEYKLTEIFKNKNISNGKLPQIDHEDTAFLQYTGGTTGRSKGAILSHKNMIANCLQAEAWFRPVLGELQESRKNDDLKNLGTMVCALPLYHIFALTACLFLGLKVSLRNLLVPNPKDFNGFVKTLRNEKFHIFPGVNTLFNSLMNTKNFEKIDFKALKISLGGGMAVTRTVAERWHEKTKCCLIEGYGLSETSPCVSVVPVTSKKYTGDVGLPVPSTMVTILNSNEKLLPVGEIGEIAVHGPQVMCGYWKNNEETKKVFTKNGHFKTGDLGRFNEKGSLQIIDRKKDLIIISGFNVYPNEIEDVVAGYPGIIECAVVGVKDSNDTEIVKLFVVTSEENFSEEEIQKFCRVNLAAYKCPKEIEVRDSLPKSNVGKILRKELR